MNFVIWLKTNALDKLFFSVMYTLLSLIIKLIFIFWLILVVILQENVNTLRKYTKLFVQSKIDAIKYDTKSFNFFRSKYRETYATSDNQNLLEYLKKCYVLLWEASILINDIVYWSFPVGFSNELSVLVFNCYFTIKILQLPEVLLVNLLHITLWGAMNLINVIFVTTMCGKTVEDVIS